MATIQEVSRRAGVSPATVSRVLTGNAVVAEPTRVRVMAAVQELGYTPNMFARGLVTSYSHSVGVIVSDLSSPYYGPLLGGIESVTERAGLHMSVSSGHARLDSERHAVTFLRQRHADALIVQLEETSDEELVGWAKGGAPLVLVGRYVAELAHVSVHLDHQLGGLRATRHLLEHGHRRVAHVAGPPGRDDSRARLAGYRQALAEARLPFDEQLVVPGDFLEESGERAVRHLWRRGLLGGTPQAGGVSAIFAANDQMAAGALRALRERGLRVPDDISLVGYDDLIFARFLQPELTTVRQPLGAMGRAAAELALAALRGGRGQGSAEPPEVVQRRFEPTLVRRGSVAAVSGPRPDAG